MKRRRYAVVGTGDRVNMFIDPIVGRFRGDAELVGLCDPSSIRRTYHQKRLESEYGSEAIPTFGDFDEMMRRQSPHCVVVCTPDHIHHEYIIRSMEYGADVISEKPLTIDGEKCSAIFETAKRTGRSVRTTFNLRWAPGIARVRELIAEEAIGRVKHIDFEYLLNTSHGADYFRRWHSRKDQSGGLLVHKSTHHFDVVNWWMNAIPKSVFAMGDLVYYGEKNATARGDHAWMEGQVDGPSEGRAVNPFFLDMDGNDRMRSLYRDAEGETGYIRDQNVFRSSIDIEDSMSVLVKYRTGEVLSYSLNAFSPREGFRACISGDRGRIEYSENYASHVVIDGQNQLISNDTPTKLVVQKHFALPYEVSIPQAEGSHGGADPLLQEQLFSGTPPVDILGRTAGHEQGAASLLIGAAANQSIQTGALVHISSLCPLPSDALHLSELV